MDEQTYLQIQQSERQHQQDQVLTSQLQELQQNRKTEVLKEKRQDKLEKFRQKESSVENYWRGPIKRVDIEGFGQNLENKLAAYEDVITFKTDINAPPNLYEELNGKSYLEKTLELSFKNLDTKLINKFILEKMRMGKLEDTKENYDKVLNNLLRRLDLGRNQQREYLIKRMALYLTGGKTEAEDDLVLTSFKRGRRINGLRR